jgi:hypothetical protein
MTTEIHISNVDFADDTELRSMCIDIGKYVIKSPTKSIETKNFYKDTNFLDKIPIEKHVDLKNICPKITADDTHLSKDVQVELSGLLETSEKNKKISNINEIFLTEK